MVEDGQISHPYIGEGYREGIKNLARWYAEGLIDAEVFTRGSSARDFLLSENLGGATHDWFASTGATTACPSKSTASSSRPWSPPASVSGKRIEEHRRIPIKPDGWAIGYTNEHPVETIKYFDFWFTEEGRRLANFGVEGEHYDMVDGKADLQAGVPERGSRQLAQMYQIGAQLQGRGLLPGLQL